MLRASDLQGRAVVDLDSAEKVGEIEELLLDPEARRVVAFLTSKGQAWFSGAERTLVPFTAVHAIGKDAVTVRHGRGGPGPAAGASEHGGTADPASLPRFSQIKGRKVVTHGGTLLGTVKDVLLDGAQGRIVGYAFEAPAGGLEALFGGHPGAQAHVHAGPGVQVGPDLIIAPEDAVVRSQEDGHDERTGDHSAGGAHTTAAPSRASRA